MENKNIKLVIFDVDDTLIMRGKSTIEESALQAIHALEANGIEVMIATGRAFFFVHKDVKERLNPDYYITTNGACVFNRNQDLIFSVPMKRDEVNTLIDYARRNDLAIAAKMKDDMPIFNGITPFKTTYLQNSKDDSFLKDALNFTKFDENDALPMGLFVMGDETIIEETRTLVSHCTYAKAYTNAYDIYSKDAGKIRGIEHVLSIRGISWENVMTFGDAANDMEMIQKAAIGVAMGNAINPLKEVANYVTKPIHEDGVAVALKHYQLI